MSVFKICLDAGHYKGYNQSKVYTKYYEGDKMWELTNKLHEELVNNYNVEVIKTRTDITKDLSLYNRGVMSKGCDMFISLHSNAVDNEKVDRVVIFKGHDSKESSTFTTKMATVISNTIGVSQLPQITTKDYNGGEYYGVLRGAKSVGTKRRYIFEHGFHTNTKTAKWLYNSNNLSLLAKNMAKCIGDEFKLDKIKSQPLYSTGVYKVTCESLNVRKEPTINSNIVTKVVYGDAFTITEVKNEFGKLKSGIGYISLNDKYVKKL